jgi:hypothetical protein
MTKSDGHRFGAGLLVDTPMRDPVAEDVIVHFLQRLSHPQPGPRRMTWAMR